MADFRWVLMRRRHQFGLSQLKVAQLMGTQQSKVSRYESGHDLYVSTLGRWCDVLGMRLVIQLEEVDDHAA